MLVKKTPLEQDRRQQLKNGIDSAKEFDKIKRIMGRGACCYHPLMKKYGTYTRKSDSRRIQRYRCHNCKKTQSNATFDPAYGQKKRRINHPLALLLASNMSMRRAAIYLQTTRKTVARKLRYIADQCRVNLEKAKLDIPPIQAIQFDELQTIEHSKCKPLAIAMVVDPKNRKILGFEVSRMPAAGHLAKISRKKYGPRPDKRQAGLTALLNTIRPILDQNVDVLSDFCPFYNSTVKSCLPKANHRQVLGEKGCVAGQGELKKVGKDPLFYINHTFAMLRANINRLIRRTWCTTKEPERLKDHLMIYTWVHNAKLLSVRNS
ncbi:transposase [Candidatus Marinamargulisbacteria bacterium SCGC AG-439-L15]|nr:transposase [Candidatus Marinamargulisbacteria bacterium SCGC AG-439-L15]